MSAFEETSVFLNMCGDPSGCRNLVERLEGGSPSPGGESRVDPKEGFLVVGAATEGPSDRI